MTTRLTDADIPPPVLEVVQILQRAGHQAFLVGGCVRDLLQGKAPQDYDVATSARPPQVRRLFRRVIPTGIAHGTVTVLQREAQVEVTTFRLEAMYLDGRRPSRVDYHHDIEVDLSRRDFTMNAMAWNPTSQQLVDPFGGAGDLHHGVVRCVGDAQKRFEEDGLRPLRAVRFAAMLGFSIDFPALRAIMRTVHVFRKVAPERIQQEFVKLVLAPHSASGLELLKRTGLLVVFLPEALDADFAAVNRTAAALTLRLTVLLAHRTDAKDVVLRLRFPNRIAHAVGHLQKHRQLPAASTSEAGLRRWLAHVGADCAQTLLDVAQAFRVEPAGLRMRIDAVLATHPPLTTQALALDGYAIMATLGTAPSATIGRATRFLLDLVLENPALNTPDALRKALAAFPPAPE